jgi:predicted ATPase
MRARELELKHIAIRNYKSLRNVSLFPKSFSVFVGRNGSGKSNFADALDFVSTAYSDGLEHAVARKGGYENIAHRKERRSRSAISFELQLTDTIKDNDFALLVGRPLREKTDRQSVVSFKHSFSIKTTGEGIRSEFRVVEESLEIIKQSFTPQVNNGYEWIKIERSNKNTVALVGDLSTLLAQAVFYNAQSWNSHQQQEFLLAPSELLFSFPLIRPRLVSRFRLWLNGISISQVSPDASRHAGVPTPNPTLSTRGENLPAVIDWLQSKKQKEWSLILQAMKEIVPELTDITVSYLHTRTLGLLFKESGVGRPWSAEEVSDGTIRSLAMLTACFDPRISALVLEEPENSLHPWIIREVIKSLRKLSREKLVIVTTHSPIVLNTVAPKDVWIVFKKDGETNIESLISFDPNLESDWQSGKYRLFDYLESGAVSEAVPTGA